MWKSGSHDFSAAKLCKIKDHLSKGGEMWLGTVSSGFESSLIVKQGPGEHGRTTKEGCEISIVPTGVGSEELIAQVALRKGGYLARTSVDQGVMTNFRFYKFIKRQNEMAPVPDANVVETDPQMMHNLVEMIRGTSWFSLLFFYFNKVPAPLVVKIPVAVVCVAFMARTLGISALTPVMAILRAFWIILRLFVDYLTDTEEHFDVWYWAFLFSLLWPLHAAYKHWCASPIIAVPSISPSRHSGSSSRSVRTESSSRRSNTSPANSEVLARNSNTPMCGALDILCKNEISSKGSPLGPVPCTNRDVKWCRIHHLDGRVEGKGKLNRFDGSEWMKTCQAHSLEYEEWVNAQECHRHGCFERRANIVLDGKQINWCLNHFERMQSVKNIIPQEETSANRAGVASSECSAISEPGSSKNLNASDLDQPLTGGKSDVTSKTPLDRIMNLQKRVLKHQSATVKEREDDEPIDSVCSSTSKHSGKTLLHPPGLNGSTQLKPEKRRQSDGEVRFEMERKRSLTNQDVTSGRIGNVPRELIKTTIKPMNMPLGTRNVNTVIPSATENELLLHRFEEIEERKDPDRTWTKMGKYVTFALRGFGLFNVSIGRGLFGAELQKSLKRQSTALKHLLWEEKIRVPLNNRIISGMALNSWGADDGQTGHKDAILLSDCYPVDSLSFDRFKLIDDKVEGHGKSPQTIYMFTKMARQQSRLFSAVYGEEHLQERLSAIERLGEIHEECPDYFTAQFISEVWERMMHQYVTCVTEGVHFIVSQHDEGVTYDKIKRYALSPGEGGGAAWKYTPVFDMDSPEGFWATMVLPEIQQERQRQDIQTLIAARVKTVPEGGRRRKPGERTGGLEKTKAAYPTGNPLTALEKKSGHSHRPLDQNGKTLCYNFSSHAGCPRGDNCPFSHSTRIKVDGLHWTVLYELARRGGHPSAKRIEVAAVPGYLQALREKNADEIKKMISTSREQTGRSVFSTRPAIVCNSTELIDGKDTLKSSIATQPMELKAECLMEEKAPEHDGRPIIFASNDFELLTRDINRVVADVPHDFLRFNYTQPEAPLRQILFKSDEWMEQERDGDREWSIPSVPTQREVEVEDYLCTAGIDGDMGTYLRERMTTSDLPLQEIGQIATNEVESIGPSFMQPLSKSMIEERAGKQQSELREEIIWGRKLPMGDCEAQDLSIGPLHYKAVDFGDTIRASDRLRKATNNVEKVEGNQCVLLHLVAGVMWNRNGRRLGIPELSKILSEAEEWRMEETSQARLAMQDCEDKADDFSSELRSLAHDVLTSGHDRDYRSIAVFFSHLLEKEQVSLRIFDIRHRDEGGYVLAVNFFTKDPNDRSSFIDLVAYKHHMRWLKPCEDTFPSNVSNWKTWFKDHISIFDLDGWRVKLSRSDNANNLTHLTSCRICSQKIKTPLSPHGFYDHFVHGSHACCESFEHPDRCGNEGDAKYPLLNEHWRLEGPIGRLAYAYLEAAKQNFSADALLEVMNVGSQMLSKALDVRLVARQIQEIQMRSNSTLAQNAKIFLSSDAALAEKIIDIHVRGAMPCYQGGEPVGPRSSGLPYEDSKTILMVQKIWKDVMKGRVLIVPSKQVDEHVKVIPTPTTTAPKRMPDRTVSDDVRIISDLRLPNLFCTKTDYPEIAITDLQEIAERVIALRRTWPHIPLTCCKRDIDAAYKRIRVHPDMSILLCTEFDLKHFGGEGGVYMMYLTLPFGWRGSPAYFSIVGEGISKALRRYTPENKTRDGAQNLHSLLYVDDAIFIEPCLGLRPDVTVTCWEHICKGLLGQDALNEEKLVEEGKWQESHILLGFEINVNTLRISLPKPKRAHALEVINQSVFNPGNRIIPVKKLQELRGLVNHWAYAHRFWKYWAAPLNAMLRFSDSTGTWIRCDNSQVLTALWNMIKLLRSISDDQEMWNLLFCGSLLDVISMDKRLCCNNPPTSVTWITGDAVINRFSSINWSRREYVLEDTGLFLDEISPGYRRIIIGDSEQLSATCSIVVWGNSEQVMLLGSDNQNVLAWTCQGYAKKGAALVLNQETAKWIVRKRITVEGFYLRSGHNFSADWMSRAEESDVVEWADSAGFSRIRFQGYWQEFIHDWRIKKTSPYVPGPSLVPKETIEDIGFCVEWNSTGGVINQAVLRRTGIPFRFVYPRHSETSAQMSQNFEHKPYLGGRIALLGGSAQTDSELQQFLWTVATYTPDVSVLMAPLGISMHQDIWEKIYVIDGAKYGDIISGLWQVGVIAKNNLKCLEEGQEMIHVMGTFGDRYSQCGIRPAGDARGIVDTVEIPHSVGLEVWIRDEHGNRRLSLNSCMRTLSLRDIRNQSWKWPLRIDNQDLVREPTIGEKCAILGNTFWWMEKDSLETQSLDILWRSTPLHVWQRIIDEVFDTLTDEGIGDHGSTFSLGSDRFNFDDEHGNDIDWIDRLHETGIHWPRFHYSYAPFRGGREVSSSSNPQDDYRAGTKDSPHLPVSRSGNPQWENQAVQRRRSTLESHGYPPFVGWETLSDSADSLYEPEVTGNPRLPLRESFWERVRRTLSSWWHHLCEPTIEAKRDPKLDALLDDTQYTVIRKEKYMGRRRSRESEPDCYRCGTNETVGAPLISLSHSLGAQGSLDAVTNNALGTETIRLLMSSLAESTQNTYLKNWTMWTRFCRRRGVSPWVDMKVHNWDAEILNFLTWEYAVMKNGSSVLATRFCAIRFLHLIEGKGDFDGKAFRIRALIEAVKRKRGIHQKLPVNPEFLTEGSFKLNFNRNSGIELWAAVMCGFHFALRIGEIEQLEDRDVAFGLVDNQACVTVTIRSSKTDQCQQGVQRTLVATNCSLCPVNNLATWLDRKTWHPQSSDKVFSPQIARRINQFLKEVAIEKGIDADRVSTHSLRAGCATTLYANKVDPIDIQRWGRWRSPIYMRYVWHENVKLHTLSHALVKKTRLNDQLLAPETKKRKVSFKTKFRCGGKTDDNSGIWDMLDQHLDGLETPFLDEVKEDKYNLKVENKAQVIRHNDWVTPTSLKHKLTHENLAKLEDERKGKFIDEDTKCYEVKLVKREREELHLKRISQYLGKEGGSGWERRLVVWK